MARLGWLQRWQVARPQPVPPLEAFDAVIRVQPASVPAGVDPDVAMAAIRRAVAAMPGAELVTVQPASSATEPISVFPASGSVAARAALLTGVRRALASALETLRSSVIQDLPIAATGFSDGQDYQFLVPFDDPAIPVAEPPATGALAELSDTDLLAQLLGLVGSASAGNTASRTIERFGSFANVLTAPDRQLSAVSGIGFHSLAAIKLIHAAALRLALAAVMEQPVLDGSTQLFDYLTAVLARESIEHFRILFLDADGRLQADEAQARGTVNHTPVYPREVVRRALELRAVSVILVHNHPSGDPAASAEDIEMTTRIEQAAEAVGLTVRDHIIVGNGRWFSFWKEGLLRRKPG